MKHEFKFKFILLPHRRVCYVQTALSVVTTIACVDLITISILQELDTMIGGEYSISELGY